MIVIAVIANLIHTIRVAKLVVLNNWFSLSSTPTGQMWSSAGSAQASQGSSLLMLGGGSESEGEGVGGINGRPGGKSSLIETSEVQEEVELLSQQEH